MAEPDHAPSTTASSQFERLQVQYYDNKRRSGATTTTNGGGSGGGGGGGGVRTRHGTSTTTAPAAAAASGNPNHDSLFDVKVLFRRLQTMLWETQRQWVGAKMLPPGAPTPRVPGQQLHGGVRPGVRVTPRALHEVLVAVVQAVLYSAKSAEEHQAVSHEHLAVEERDFKRRAQDLVDGVEPYTALHLSVLRRIIHDDSVRFQRGVLRLPTELCCD